MRRAKMIQPEKDLRPYFKELVESAVSHQDLDATPVSCFYIVNLLSEFMKTEQLFDVSDDKTEETPLAIMLVRALNAEPALKVRIFKRLGDVSLYVAGYFSDHIDGKPVDVDYYISMGGGAYKNLSGLLSKEKTFAELYAELSDKFASFVQILSEVRNLGGNVTNTDLLRLYERWLKTGDPWIRERLEKEGIRPQKIDITGENH